jgi:hypothetical protein
MQYTYIYRTVSLCGNPQNYGTYYNVKLYKIVKIGWKLAGRCDIIGIIKMCNGAVYNIKLQVTIVTLELTNTTAN